MERIAWPESDSKGQDNCERKTLTGQPGQIGKLNSWKRTTE
jgi:hypothetical protein